DALDQHDRRFHAVVMRLSFEMQDDGALAFAPVQTPLATLPLRYEYAYGGENKVLVGDPAARRVPQRDRLPGRQPLPGSTGSPQAIA
ncbi:hypothetical protein FPK54_25150, partial [Acinetobacter baumannii]|nr:hypothetical protein [Acinetobacter baumannii]